MFERRRQTRFHPGSTLSVTLNLATQQGNSNLSGHVEDVSSRGFLAVLPEQACRDLSVGQEVKGELRSDGHIRPWVGSITHLNHRSGGIGVGIVLTTSFEDAAPLKQTVEQVIQDPKTGGINLHRHGDKLVLEIVGHLSLPLSREFLHLVRGGTLSAISLTQCKGMDSAGLGMLCIAADAKVPLTGAQGIVKELLDVARIPQGNPATTQRVPAPPITSNPIRTSGSHAPSGSRSATPRTTRDRT